MAQCIQFCSAYIYYSMLSSVWFLLFYAIATVIQLYHDGGIMYELRRGKSEPTLLPTQGIINLPHHIGMV